MDRWAFICGKLGNAQLIKAKVSQMCGVHRSLFHSCLIGVIVQDIRPEVSVKSALERPVSCQGSTVRMTAKLTHATGLKCYHLSR